MMTHALSLSVFDLCMFLFDVMGLMRHLGIYIFVSVLVFVLSCSM
jgi:hypothetical protein